jgi:regulator of nucleoside diphosphate kinase
MRDGSSANDARVAAAIGQRRVAFAFTLAMVIALTVCTEAGVLPPVVLALVTGALMLRFALLFEVPVFLPHIVVTDTDTDRLSRLLDALPDKQRRAACALELELERAQVVPSREVPVDVVTMNSRVVFEEVTTGLRRKVRLVYPHDFREEVDGDSAVSILAPVGSALLGLRVGQTIDWRMPSGRLRRYQIVDVVYQPEAAGHLHL